MSGMLPSSVGDYGNSQNWPEGNPLRDKLRYANGDEELYDHARSPHESTGDAGVKASLKAPLPRVNVQPIAVTSR